MSSLESVLKACDAADLLSKLQDMGISSIHEVAECEPKDLCDDLGIDETKAKVIVTKAKEDALFLKRKEAVQRTWKAVEDSLAVDATKLFYQRLFEQYPQVKPLFEKADMEAQATKLYKTVSLAVKYLDDVESLLPELEELGKRHATEWSCKREHYDAVGECLVWTLQQGLGDAWTPEVADAWTFVYGVISKVKINLSKRHKSIVAIAFGLTNITILLRPWPMAEMPRSLKNARHLSNPLGKQWKIRWQQMRPSFSTRNYSKITLA